MLVRALFSKDIAYFVDFLARAYRHFRGRHRGRERQLQGGQQLLLARIGFGHLASHHLATLRMDQFHHAELYPAELLVPVPQVRDFTELNAALRQQCVEDRQRRLRGQKGSKEELLKEDQAAFLALPAAPFAACRQASTTINSLSLVRFDCNDYSVPVQWAHGGVVVKGDWQEVRLYVQRQEVARHERIWAKEKVHFEPLHYLALLERKPGALDHARPLAGWTLPECLGVLRRRLENERDGDGTREYIRVLRLLEKHSLAEVRAAVEKALTMGAITRDAIAQFLFPRED